MASIPAVTQRVRVLYGFGSVAYGVKDQGFSYFLLIYYSQVLGLPGTLVGAALFIALMFDAVSDPLVGYWSDNTRSKLGRRHPFMYTAVIPLVVAYYFLWQPPVELLDETGLFIYLIILSVLVRFFITLYEIPSTSLVAELTTDYDERTRLLGYRYMFGWIGGLGIAILALSTFFKATPEFAHGLYNPAGYKPYVITGCILMAISILVSSVGLRKFIPYLKQPPVRDKKWSFSEVFSEVWETLSNRNFLVLFLAAAFSYIGWGIETNLNTYASSFFWEFTSEKMAIINSSLLISAVVGGLLAPWFVRRFDKKHAAMGLFGFFIFFSPLLVFMRLMGWYPDNQWEYLLPVAVVHYVVIVSALVMFGAVQSSMLADVVEQSEINTARREEGLFFAARTFAHKCAQGFGTLFAGVALDLIAFPRDALPGEVSEEVLTRFGFIYGPLVALFFFLALVAISFYTITRKEHEDRLVELSSPGENND